MARSNGPFGPPGTRAPPRRHPADDPFAPPAQGSSDQGASQHGQGYHFPPEPEPNFGYGQQHAPQQWGQQPEPRGYDLGNYLPPGSQPYTQVEPAPFHQPHHGSYGGPQQAYAESDGYDDEFVDEEEQPRRGRRWMLIAAALVGAIGVGGALAYTYKSFIAPNSGRVPWVKAGDPNVKVKPDNRGGKELANSDKRMLGRLADDVGQQKAAAEEDRAGEDGPRRVKTIPIPVGGGPPAAEQPPPAVPGIMLENVPSPRGQPAPKVVQPLPGRVTLGQPPPAQEPAPAEEARPPPARKPPVHVPAVAAKPPVAKAKETPPAVATTGAGYVAVLSSQKTHIDALKAFADLQQKYSDVLAGKTPAVQEADLGERGVWYRAVVGPPGSRDAANGVCSQLKSAGHVGCWVSAY